MQIEIFTFCGDVRNEPDQLDILEVGVSLASTSVPARCHKGFIVLRARFDETDMDDHSFGIVITDSDGKILSPPDGTKVFPGKRPAGTQGLYTCIWNFHGYTFTRFGHYWVDLLVDGDQSHRIPISVQKG